jgi:hypothetical protein
MYTAEHRQRKREYTSMFWKGNSLAIIHLALFMKRKPVQKKKNNNRDWLNKKNKNNNNKIIVPAGCWEKNKTCWPEELAWDDATNLVVEMRYSAAVNASTELLLVCARDVHCSTSILRGGGGIWSRSRSNWKFQVRPGVVASNQNPPKNRLGSTLTTTFFPFLFIYLVPIWRPTSLSLSLLSLLLFL